VIVESCLKVKHFRFNRIRDIIANMPPLMATERIPMKTPRHTQAAAPPEPAGRGRAVKASNARASAQALNGSAAAPAADASEPAVQRLADYLCFAVYSANLAFGRAYRPILDELGLTYTQYIAVIVLWESGSLTVGALGEKLFLESNTLTPILKKLEAMGYLRRQRDPSDERQVLVSLTEEGRRLRENALCKSLFNATGLSAEEFPKLQQAVVALRDNLIKSVHPDE
jgi:DNA-binding MarR family transcriptional regulator